MKGSVGLLDTALTVTGNSELATASQRNIEAETLSQISPEQSFTKEVFDAVVQEVPAMVATAGAGGAVFKTLSAFEKTRKIVGRRGRLQRIARIGRRVAPRRAHAFRCR